MTTALSRADQKAYVDEVGSALTAFQMIEECLKTTIDACYRLVRAKLNGGLPFKFSGEDVENAPLGRLVGIYKKFSDSDVLIARLEKLQSARNHIAHRALVVGFSHVTKSRREYETELKRVRAVSADAWDVLKLMLSEMNSETTRIEGMVEGLQKEP